MIGRAARRARLNTLEAKAQQIQLLDKRIDNAHRVVFSHIIIKTFRKQRALLPVFTFYEALH